MVRGQKSFCRCFGIRWRRALHLRESLAAGIGTCLGADTRFVDLEKAGKFSILCPYKLEIREAAKSKRAKHNHKGCK